MTLRVKWSPLGARDGSGPLASYTAKGNGTVSFPIKVRWADRHLALQQLVGYSVPVTYGSDPVTGLGVRRLSRELPEPYHDDPNMYCASAKVVRGLKWIGRTAYDRVTWETLPGYPNREATPEDEATGDRLTDLWKQNVYKLAVIQCEFSQAKFYIRSDEEAWWTYQGNELSRYTTFRDERAANYQTIRQGFTYYVLPRNPGEEQTPFDSRRQIPHSQGLIEFETTLYVTWENVHVDCLPLETIDGLVGKTNKTTFLNKPAGSLLFLPPKIERYVMANGQLGADVTFGFGHFAPGQNKILYVDGTGRRYVWVTFNKAIEQDPTPGQLPVNTFLHDEVEFADAFNCNKP